MPQSAQMRGGQCAIWAMPKSTHFVCRGASLRVSREMTQSIAVAVRLSLVINTVKGKASRRVSKR